MSNASAGGPSIARISIGVFIGGVAVLVVYKFFLASPQTDMATLVANSATARQKVEESKVAVARNEVVEIARLSEQYMLQKGGQCPRDMQDLKSAGVVARTKNDPWGSPYTITCQGSSAEVGSNGPDKSPGTSDDLNSSAITK